MRQFINYSVVVLLMTFSILFSYGKISDRVTTFSIREICQYMQSYSIRDTFDSNLASDGK